MEKKLDKTTNKEILSALEGMNKGVTKKAGNELVFDPKTGEFVVAANKNDVSPDAVTINQIAQDGFAKQL